MKEGYDREGQSVFTKNTHDTILEGKKETIEAYLHKTNNVDALRQLRVDIETKQQGYREVWQSGFENLDRLLNGGFKPERLYILGAISSLGKTSMALQIAIQLAESGKDTMIFSLEMSQIELNAKMISHYSWKQTAGKSIADKFRQKNRLTVDEIIDGKIGGLGSDKRQIFEEAFEAVERLGDHIRIIQGDNDIDVDKIRNYIDCHIRATNRKPFVIIDYLQILQPSKREKDDRLDKRLLTDDQVTMLKTIARNYSVPIFVISAFNRANYLSPVSMGSFRESSGIEYSSDSLMAMQYKGMDYLERYSTEGGTGRKQLGFESAQEHDSRVRKLFDRMNRDGAAGKALPIELKILKNRSGAKGCLDFLFYPAFGSYEVSGCNEHIGKEITEKKEEGRLCLGSV